MRIMQDDDDDTHTKYYPHVLAATSPILAALKLCGVIQISWWLVATPIALIIVIPVSYAMGLAIYLWSTKQ